ncbi:MAG: sodium:solute symporter family protein, partial [Kordiimonadaceae bacterium]|nr:sodium:solute symporter family protein [Kordiimonadaceae bacterium]
ETVMIWAAKNMVPEILGALLLAGIMAAALSSASTFLSLVGFSISNDIIKRDEPLTLKTTRILMFVTGIIVLIASFYFPANIFWLMLFIGTVFASSWGVVAMMSVWSKKITAAGAFWGISAGFMFNVVPAVAEYIGLVTWPSYLNPAILGIVASLIVTTLVSKNTKVTRKEAVYRMRLHRAPVTDCDQAKTRMTLIAPKILIVFGAVMPFIMMIYYVIPYQTGAGKLLADGSIDWFSGEALLAMSWALLHIPLGIMSIIVIRKRYSSGARVRNRSMSNEELNKGELEHG